MFRPATRRPARQRTLAAALVTATILGGFSVQTAWADAPLVFEPAADALVKSGTPTGNFGTSSVLQADTSPVMESYLRFTVSGVVGAPVARARLRLFAVDGTQNGPVLYPSATTWTETGVTWRTRPARTGPAAGNLKVVSAGAWVEYDVTSLITGDGTYSFSLVADSTDGADFRSREATGDRPQLVVELAGPDETPPDTTITAGPVNTVPQTTATFAFASTEAGSTFSCSLDGAEFAACSSPASFTGLEEREHTFVVAATDPAGNTDPDPATRTWTVDTTAPVPIPPLAGTINTIAGTGTPGGKGDGGPAVLGQLDEPRTLAVDAAGNIYVADTYNHSIRKIDTQGVMTTVAGTGSPGSSSDGGPATAAKLETPHSVALDSAGNLYIADSPNQRIRKVDVNGIITTVAGTGSSGFSGDGGPATKAKLNYPKGIDIGADGLLYIADSLNNRVRRVDASGIITTVAGTGPAGYSGDGGPAKSAKLNRPRNIIFDANGVLWIADDLNFRVRKVSPSGVITTYAGTGVDGFSGDGGPATAARFSHVRDIALDSAGNLFVADELNSRIRRIDAGGTITTYAGTGANGFSGDGGLATSAKLYHPRGVAIGPDGRLVVADTFNHRIRKIS